MIKIILAGCNGYMGRVITSLVKDDPDFTIIAGIDVNDQDLYDYPVVSSPNMLTDKVNAGLAHFG